MIPPGGMAIAAITLMLWILWSDSIRPRRSSQVVYAVRVGLYIVVAAVLLLDRVRYPWLFSTSSTVLVAVAALIGVFGAVHFARRLVLRS